MYILINYILGIIYFLFIYYHLNFINTLFLTLIFCSWLFIISIKSSGGIKDTPNLKQILLLFV